MGAGHLGAPARVRPRPRRPAAHPEWQLKDAANTPLYVGTRVAADFGNPGFRAWWIAQAQTALATGNRGLYVDDVFMERRTSTAARVARTAIDPRTGAAMTEANWQKAMADFMVAVRAALPGAEIVHDVLWHKGDGGDVLRELQAADYVAVDGGFTTNVTYGTSTYGFQTLARLGRARAGTRRRRHLRRRHRRPGPAPLRPCELLAGQQRQLGDRQRRLPRLGRAST